jgi:hypothetical protein
MRARDRYQAALVCCLPGIGLNVAKNCAQEISALAWHAVAHLPASRDQDSQVGSAAQRASPSALHGSSSSLSYALPQRIHLRLLDERISISEAR